MKKKKKTMGQALQNLERNNKNPIYGTKLELDNEAC